MPAKPSVTEYHKMRCPGCGDDTEIDVLAEVYVRLTPDGSDANEAGSDDHYWDPDSNVVCRMCDEEGTVADFTVETDDDEEDDEED